ncbi:cupin domain protein [Geobacter sp. OR-1]|uniref:cupin domain-containing protein n=1 Tax=Geobacter sp. OR-1 TaxID=1266765 RepID=UPI00054210DA|nr:cupin domain-containing protein [Geobacter sp. OR-1]GAM07960.1 cupin domain protein [Geobacter sp. OR-1]
MAIRAEQINLVEAVGYQDGAVVSKTLVDKKAGTITLFAFAAGQGLSEHTAPFDALVQVVDGEAKVTVDGVDYLVKAGEMIIMPANYPHSLAAESPFKMVLVMIRA